MSLTPTTSDARHVLAGRRLVALGLLACAVVAIVALLARIVHGPTDIPLSAVVDALLGRPTDPTTALVVRDLRLPAALTGLLAGASLGVAGLQMQTLFGNPLADPYVLGVSSGASLGVASVLLLGASVPFVGATGFTGSWSTMGAACVGAAAVMGLVLVVGTVVKSPTTLLLLGVMLGAMVSALVMVMLASARPEMVADYIAWSFGSYRGTTRAALGIVAPVLLVALAASLLMAPWLNVLALGERYAATMGVNVTLVRIALIGLCAVLAGATTACCGPIQFLGIAIPHVARQLFRTADLRILLPATALLGAGGAVAIDVLASLPSDALPLNAANAAIGGPVVVWVLLRRARSVSP